MGISKLNRSLDEDGMYRLNSLSRSITDVTMELKELKSDLDKCTDLKEIVDLSAKYDIFEGCEEILIGAFLGINIIIN